MNVTDLLKPIQDRLQVVTAILAGNQRGRLSPTLSDPRRCIHSGGKLFNEGGF